MQGTGLVPGGPVVCRGGAGTDLCSVMSMVRLGVSPCRPIRTRVQDQALLGVG